MAKLITAENAASLIKNRSTIAVCGFAQCALPEEVLQALEDRFTKTGYPQQLTLVHTAGIGDGVSKGASHFAHEGMLKRVIAGHYNLAPKLGKLVMDNKVEGYNLPQGTMAQWFRSIAGRKPGLFTRVGLNTFVDPRIEGGKLNSITKEDLVEVKELDGEEYLWYKPFPIDVAIVHGTCADLNGNVSTDNEEVRMELLPMALAAKASGGIVIVQVETLAENRTIPPKHVVLPGIDVDYIVLSKVRQVQNPAYTGEMRMPLSQIPPMALNARKVIARRAAMELVPNAVVNLGIGIPEGVSSVANEEGIGDQLTLTVEAGPIGGVPASGADFGGSANADAIVDHPYQFDFYDGGGLDMAFLGMAECNAKGDVNVSKFKDCIAGCGGFINITQNTHKVVFCGTFTAKGLREEIRDGKLVITHEGAVQKFIDKVGQITFSADYAHKHNQQVMFITERCVFVLTDKGLVLTEIAPGVDLQKDILDQMEFVPHIAEDLKTMDERIFRDEPMGLAQDIFEQQAS